MRSHRWTTILVLLSACGGAANVQTAPTPAAPAGAAARAAATITAADVQRHVTFLASDALRGRDTPSPGLEEAARYAADRFRALGFQPAGDSGTYIRRFSYDSQQLDRNLARLEMRTGGRATALHYARDYFVLPAAVDSVVAEPVFLGLARAGLSAPATARDGIIVAFVPDTAMASWQQHAIGVIQAAMRGAARGVVLVLDPLFSEAQVGNIAHQIGGQVLPIPVVGLRHSASTRLSKSASSAQTDRK
jgi:hypothetical protein